MHYTLKIKLYAPKGSRYHLPEFQVFNPDGTYNATFYNYDEAIQHMDLNVCARVEFNCAEPIIKEMAAWIEDCGININKLTDNEILHAVKNNYEGGLAAWFLSNSQY